MFETINFTSLRQNLASILDRVADDHKPILVTRQNGKKAVIMSVDDFNSYEETAYLLASPKNAKRLLDAAHNVEAGKIRHENLTD